MEAVYCNSLDGGRIKLKRIVRDVMARKDTRNLVLEVDPGVGKTRTALHQAAKYGHQRKILYSAPNHELAEESYDRFCGLPGHPAAYSCMDATRRTARNSTRSRRLSSLVISLPQLSAATVSIP